MDYEIVKLYTERLDISSFKNSMGNENIESIAKFTTSIVPIEQSETSTFVIEYSMRGVNKPISLNWVAIAVLKQDKSDNRKLNEKILLNDEQIKEFIMESMDKFSFLLGGKLPDIFKQLDDKND